MAGLSNAPVDKDVLLQALGEGPESEAVPGDVSLRDYTQHAQGTLSSQGDAQYDEEPSGEEDDGLDSFEEFLNAPDSGPSDDDRLARGNQSSSLGAQAITQPSGVLAGYRSTGQLRQSLSEQGTQKGLGRLRRDLAAKVQAAEDSRSSLGDEEQKLRGLRQQAERGTLDPARLNYQEREVSRALEKLTDCEKARDAAELALHCAGDQGKRTKQACDHESSHHAAVAHARHDDEVRRAQRHLSQEEAKRQEAQALEDARAQEKARKDGEARRHQKMGQQRLKGSLAKHNEQLQELEEVREARYQHDAQRFLGLKESIDNVKLKVQSSNEAQRKKDQKKRAEQEARKQQLLNEGHNPYEVWRREEMGDKKEKEKDKSKALNELRSEKLIEQLMTEDRTYKKNKGVAEKERQAAREYQRNMGRATKEEKIATYIRKKTIGGVEVLDPTGTALRIDPSKVSVMKTHAFGLGKASSDEIRKVATTLQSQRQNVLSAQGRYKIVSDKQVGILPKPDAKAQVSQWLSPGETFDTVEKQKSPNDGRIYWRLGDGRGWVPQCSPKDPNEVIMAPVEPPEEEWGSEEDMPQDSPEEQQRASSKGIAGAPTAVSSEGWVPKRTALEEQMFEAAKLRQKENITSVQRCWGKEFQGAAFLAKPSIITFEDFEVGKRYRQVIEVTNVSYTFNQFKLLPLEDQVKDFFEINFEPPGRMSAGVTRYITLWFCPKVNTDIDSTFPILAKTGRIDFPLRCRTRKTVLTVTPQDADANPIINFGQVLAGESSKCVLSVKNSGATAAAFELEPEDPASGGEFLKMVQLRPERGEFVARANTNVSFIFTPKAVGSYSAVLRLKISNGATGDANFEEEKQVLLRGSCIDVPIYVEKPTYDVKTCIFGHIFRESVVVYNRRSVPMKIDVVEPRQIEAELQINPPMAYIQGNKEQTIQIKFCPKANFLDKNPQFRDAERKDEQGAFRIPVKIVGAEQVLPVETELVGTLTTNEVRFEPSVVTFGRCFVGSVAVNRLALFNESSLPQRYFFTKMPNVLAVQDVPSEVIDEEAAGNMASETAVLDGGGDGACGTLLPGESRALCLIYSPEAATELNAKVVVKSIAGGLCAREFTVECKGQGVGAPLSLSHNVMELASVPCETLSKESVVVSNVSKVPYTINLLLPPPEICGLKASPVCCTIGPQQSQRLQLEFRPTRDYVKLLEKPEEPPLEGEAAEAAAAAEAEAAAAEDPEAAQAALEAERGEVRRKAAEEHRLQKLDEIQRQGGRRWEEPVANTVHSSWKLAICIKPQASGGIGRDQSSKKDVQTMYLGVTTCVLPKLLTAAPEILDFGEVTAQQRKLLPLTLSIDPGADTQDLKLEALPENQCFTVLSAPRSISGKKPFKLMVQFDPQQVQIYQCVLTLRTQSTKLEVPLKGRGVAPVLKIEPADGVLRLGSVVYNKDCKDYTTEKLEICNESSFELCYALETVVDADPNHTGPPPFTLTPSTGVVAANGRRSVTVTFRPHRPMAVFRQKVLVSVPNQDKQTFVYLYGHCFRYQTYALRGMELGAFSKSEVKAPTALVDALSVGTGVGAHPETGIFRFPEAQQKKFTLTFEGEERNLFMLIGGSVPPGTPHAPQNPGKLNYEFTLEESEFTKYFKIEAEGMKAPEKVAKGEVMPGKPPIKVNFKYSPDENTSLKYGDVNLDLLGGIGQWITCKVKGVLAGGAVPQGEPPSQEISIELRAKLQQI